MSKCKVRERALIARINRKLAPGEMALRIARGASAQHDVGQYYLLNWRRESVVRTHVSLEQLARELGVLRPWEEISAAVRCR
jgi:hypothetical protein